MQITGPPIYLTVIAIPGCTVRSIVNQNHPTTNQKTDDYFPFKYPREREETEPLAGQE